MRKLVRFALILVAAGLALAHEPLPQFDRREYHVYHQILAIRRLPDGKRVSEIKRMASVVRALPPGPAQSSLARILAMVSTQYEFGKDTLQDLAVTLAGALEQQQSECDAPYFELAQLIRYEHVNVTLDNPRVTAQLARLDSDDRDRQLADFTLADTTGKTWTLKSLGGQVVLVNFWATSCVPCLREMPDLNALYRRFQPDGLVILAVVSEEEPAQVKAFLAKHKVDYPVLLDSGTTTRDHFHVDRFPKSFIFNRGGKLIAQSIDLGAPSQLTSLLEQAGLNVSNKAPPASH